MPETKLYPIFVYFDFDRQSQGDKNKLLTLIECSFDSVEHNNRPLFYKLSQHDNSKLVVRMDERETRNKNIANLIETLNKKLSAKAGSGIILFSREGKDNSQFVFYSLKECVKQTYLNKDEEVYSFVKVIIACPLALTLIEENFEYWNSNDGDGGTFADDWLVLVPKHDAELFDLQSQLSGFSDDLRMILERLVKLHTNDNSIFHSRYKIVPNFNVLADEWWRHSEPNLDRLLDKYTVKRLIAPRDESESTYRI